MNNKIELLKAIKVEIKDNLSLASKSYIYSVDTDSCVVTSEYVSEYIKPDDRDRDRDRDSNLNTDINGIRLQSNDIIDYEDIYDDINDYEYPYNHINRNNLV